MLVTIKKKTNAYDEIIGMLVPVWGISGDLRSVVW